MGYFAVATNHGVYSQDVKAMTLDSSLNVKGNKVHLIPLHVQNAPAVIRLMWNKEYQTGLVLSNLSLYYFDDSAITMNFAKLIAAIHR